MLLADLVGALAEIRLDAARLGLGGRVEDRAVDVEVPAVIAAADPALRRYAELERSAAVRAMPVEEPEAAGLVAERDEVLAEQPHGDRQVFQLGRQQERMPVAAHVLAARRARPDVREQRVVAGLRPVVITAVRQFPLGG